VCDVCVGGRCQLLRWGEGLLQEVRDSYVYIHSLSLIYTYMYIACDSCLYVVGTVCDITGIVERYRVAKTHRIPYLYRSFSAKVTYI